MVKQLYRKAFALPSILIASVVMLMVLVTAITSVVATSNALDDQYYNQLAKEAAESGVAKAQACLKANNYIAQWSGRTLRPNTDCAGNTITTGSPYVLNTPLIQTSFSVPYPETLSNGIQKVTASSSVNRIRSSNGDTWRSYSFDSFAVVSATVTFNNVTFGYTSEAGAFFGTIGADGKVSALGYNGLGQLGNGTITSASFPRGFTLPAGTYATGLYSNFLSVGYAMFAITNDGRLYGAGSNDAGQLGNGSVSAAQPTPVQFQLPTGVQARYVSMLRQVTFVIANNNNVYAAGKCDFGQLGSNYTIAGCSDRSTYVRVALPTPNVADLNTLPVAESDWVQSTNLATDRYNAYIRMQGGRVYGWGSNEYGQLGNGTTTASSLPLKMGAFGDAGQTKATQVAYDGETMYVLDSAGDVYVTGRNNQGKVGGAMAPVSSSTGLCLDNPGNSVTSGTRVRVYTCNNSTAQKLEWNSDGSIKFRPNSTTELCLDNANNAAANGNPIRIYTCNGTVAQRWEYRDNGSIYHPSTGMCIDNPNNSAASGPEIQLYGCNATAAQTWGLESLLTFSKVPIPAASGKVLRITTDQWTTLFLTEDGKVWGAGTSTRGQLGNGRIRANNPALSQFILPSGRTAVDFYTTKAGVDTSDHANTYVILDDGSVWGAGANTYGQLGNNTVTASEATPRKMLLPTGVRAQSVQSGLGTTVILTDQGKIYTVGNNTHGQLGDGTTVNSGIPRANEYTNVVPTTYY